ncbi:MerR family transcriptional regulator [Micromonospora chersina]|uniref:MerR family transcriptional regulator n=1 Tax=Micromonospora chersina TaxID=47854 RepID=UPI0033CD6378
MRISDLAKISGTPVPTIKFYVREGLLPPGRPTGRNQAEYGEAHITRLRLIRVLTGIGRLNLSSVREVIGALDNKGLTMGAQCRATIRALFAEMPEHEVAASESVRTRVNEFVDGLGWDVDCDSPGRVTLAVVLAALHRLGDPVDVDVFAPYAEAAAELARFEMQLFTGDASNLVARTVLLEAAFAAMRRMAQERHLARQLGLVGD